jgi:hypothetical protein
MGLVQDVQLSDVPGSISWWWTEHGTYTARSAYVAQFKGSCCSFNFSAIWRAQAEGKHNIFAWLLIQSKLLTADRLLGRNWPCNPVCVLCDQAFETAYHLCLECVYAREVWELVSHWVGQSLRIPVLNVAIEQWWKWNASLQGLSHRDQRQVAAVLIYTAWNLWKESNRRIFYRFRSHLLEFSSSLSKK